MNHFHSSSKAAERGGMLVEACIVALLIGLLLSLALPSFADAIQRKRVESTTHQLRSDLAFAQTAAVSTGGTVRLDLAQSRAGSCYVIHRGGNCRCGEDGQPQCDASAEPLKAVLLPAAQGVRLTANVAGMSFDGTRRTVTPAATLTVSAPQVGALRTVVNVLGRSRVCSAGYSASGYRPC